MEMFHKLFIIIGGRCTYCCCVLFLNLPSYREAQPVLSHLSARKDNVYNVGDVVIADRECDAMLNGFIFPKWYKVSTPWGQEQQKVYKGTIEYIQQCIKKFPKRACAACGVKKSKDNVLYVCANCQSVKYCSRHCQKIHWKFCHRFCCEGLRKVLGN